MRIGRIIAIAVGLGLAYLGGWQHHAHNRGEVRLFWNQDDGGPLNRGQNSLSIKFPSGVTPDHIRLPDGHIYPDPAKPRWLEVLADGKKKTWLDGFEVEFGGR